MIRVRLNYSKNGSLRFIGHLDLHKVWERIVRRAKLPIAYSQGFHPQPRMNQACPLPLGIASKAEVLDMWFNEDVDAEIIKESLSTAAPDGITIQDVNKVDLSLPKIQTLVEAVEYEMIFKQAFDADHTQQRIAALMSEETIIRTRRKKNYDLRPLIKELELVEKDGKDLIRMLLSAGQGPTGRPDEVADALNIPLDSVLIERTNLIVLEAKPK